ncbi:trp operon leader peptide [Streptomyces sp. SID7803]|nr:trp operon leader peptide [Streptomyces sp. SID7803]
MTETHVSARPGGWARVRSMFAHSTRDWWWTAHPAAH